MRYYEFVESVADEGLVGVVDVDEYDRFVDLAWVVVGVLEEKTLRICGRNCKPFLFWH